MALRVVLVIWLGAAIAIAAVYSWLWLPTMALLVLPVWALGKGLVLAGTAFERWSGRLYGEPGAPSSLISGFYSDDHLGRSK